MPRLRLVFGAALVLSACAPAISPLPPVPSPRPEAPPPNPPAFETPPAATPESGVLRRRDIATGERQDSVLLADQRRRQQSLTADGQRWDSLRTVSLTHEVLFRWREIRGGLPSGARFELAEVVWPARAQVTSVSDTVIRINVKPMSAEHFGRMEWRGDAGAIGLEMTLRPGKTTEWILVSLHPSGPLGEVSGRFHDRLRSLALQMPLLLNEWVLGSRTQTILEQP